LIELVASKRKPMMISTGVATLEEIQEVVEACRRQGNNDITLLKCTSAYPAPVDAANLRTIPDMVQRFGVKVGISDHTMGALVALGAVAIGAKVVEKHFILDRAIGGPDASFSMVPEEFKAMVEQIRAMESALGQIEYMSAQNPATGAHFKRSLFVAENIRAGEVFTQQNVRSVRPNVGLAPKHLPEVLGRIAKRDIPKGTPFLWDLCER